MEKYTTGKMLGKGSYGAAYLVHAKADGKTYVMKDISLHGLSKKEIEVATQEAQVSSSKTCNRGRSKSPVLIDSLLHCPYMLSAGQTLSAPGSYYI